jgi:hypothetical protein
VLIFSYFGNGGSKLDVRQSFRWHKWFQWAEEDLGGPAAKETGSHRQRPQIQMRPPVPCPQTTPANIWTNGNKSIGQFNCSTQPFQAANRFLEAAFSHTKHFAIPVTIPDISHRTDVWTYCHKSICHSAAQSQYSSGHPGEASSSRFDAFFEPDHGFSTHRKSSHQVHSAASHEIC